MGKYLLTLGLMAILAMMLVPYTGQVVADDEEDDKIICDSLNPLTGVVDGDVNVPAGEKCVMTDATINGDVEVEGSLLNSGASTINGDLKGEGPGEINVPSTDITGDAEIDGKDFVRLGNGGIVTIGGNVELEENVDVELKNLKIKGDVEIEDNTNVAIFNDKIEGELKVEGNGAVTLSQTEVSGEAECEGDVTNPNGANTYNDENDGCPA